MRTALLLSTLLAAVTPCLCQNYTAPGYSARQLYQMANGTWINNIVPRSNSTIYMRMALFDRPEVYEVDTMHQHGGPRSIHRFPDSYGLTGITEIGMQKYAALAMSHGESGQYVSVWTLDQSGTESKAEQIIEKVGDLSALGAITTLSPSVVLACETAEGTVYRIDLTSRTVELVLTDPTGTVDGIQYRKPYLYYSNGDAGVFSRVPIDPVTARPTGDVEVLASGEVLKGASDFALPSWGPDAFVANFNQNSVVRVGGGSAEVIVQGIPMPTTAQFGSSGYLHVGTSGRGGDGGASIWSVYVPDAPPY